MSRGTPDISDWIRIKKLGSSSATDATLASRKTRSVVPHSFVTASSVRIRRLPPNALVPLKISARQSASSVSQNVTSPPTAPSSVTFGTFTNWSVVASWPTVSGATSYTLRVYESDTSSISVNSAVAYTFENAVSGSTFNFVTSVVNGKYYAVGVSASSQYGTSSVRLSSVKSTLPVPPPIVTLTKPVSDGMVITWDDGLIGIGASSYTVKIYTNTTSSITTESTLVGTYTSAVSGSKFAFVPVDNSFYSATITSVNSTGSATNDISVGGYVRYTLTNTADYNYQFKIGNIQPTVLHGAVAYDTGSANSWVIRLRKTDYDGDNLTSVLTTALSTAGTLVLSNIANAGQKLTFTVTTFLINAYDHFEIVATKDNANSTLLTDDTIIKTTITAAENPIVEYVYSATSSPPNTSALVNDPGSGAVKFQPVIGSAKINLAISKTTKPGVDVSSWHTDNGTIGKTFRLRLVSDATLFNFTSVIEARVDRTTHWEYNLSAPTSQTPPAGQPPGITFPADVNIALI
jgi:hypothetical protein